MPTTPWIPTVKKITNGEFVVDKTVNPIIEQLAKREQHLYEKFAELEDKSILIAYDILVNPSSTLAANSVVFYNVESGLDLAQIGFSASAGQSVFTPIHDSFTFGIVKSVTTAGIKKADVMLQGLVEKEGIVASLLQPNEALTLGPLYLSKTTPGKLTAVPGGLSIYIGYALTADQFYLHPNNEALNQFFFNYKFNLLERPAGIPMLITDNWSVTNPEPDKTGWLNVADSPFASLAPTNSSYFYNIPSAEDIAADNSLTEEEKAEANELRDALPPYPEHFTFMIINGLLQRAYTDTYQDGKFVINKAGLWWIGSASGHQPWSSDLVANISTNKGVFAVTTSTVNSKLGFVGHGLTDGVLIKVNGTSLPTPLSSGIYYYVVNADANTFQLSTTLNGAPITLLTNGSAVYVEFTPTVWGLYKGSDYLRPRMNLHFVKVNPDYKLTTVSTLTSDSPAIKYLNASNPNEVAKNGDILTRLEITNNVTAESPLTSQFIKSIVFNKETGAFDILTGKGVTELAEGTGIKLTTSVEGKTIVSVSNFNFGGAVTDIEPENSRLETLGLHFYTNLTHPSTSVPNGFVGKFQLPENVPTQNLQISMLLFPKTTPSSGETVKIRFEYSISAPNVVLTDARISGNSGNDISISFPTGTVARKTFIVSPSSLIIPASALKNSAFVNFRIERKDSTYTGDIGVVGVYWKIS